MFIKKIFFNLLKSKKLKAVNKQSIVINAKTGKKTLSKLNLFKSKKISPKNWLII